MGGNPLFLCLCCRRQPPCMPPRGGMAFFVAAACMPPRRALPCATAIHAHRHKGHGRRATVLPCRPVPSRRPFFERNGRQAAARRTRLRRKQKKSACILVHSEIRCKFAEINRAPHGAPDNPKPKHPKKQPRRKPNATACNSNYQFPASIADNPPPTLLPNLP